MTSTSLLKRLAVCSWSLHPAGPADLICAVWEIGIPRIQLALDPLRALPAVWGNIAEMLSEHRMGLASGMFATVGEDYSTLESIRRTGGLVPDEHWPENWKNIQEIASIAHRLGLRLVTFHAGFLPEDEGDPAYGRVLDRLARVADLFAPLHIDLGLETGQETAETLAAFLRRLNRPNVGVNFDPANLLLYDKGDPIQAVRRLGPWLKQCHIKDALQTKTPGTWGEEVATGSGQVDWRAFLATLDALHFTGSLCIEREAGNQRIRDIAAARQHLLHTLPAAG